MTTKKKETPYGTGICRATGNRRAVRIGKVVEGLYRMQTFRPITPEDFRSDGTVYNSGVFSRRNKNQLVTDQWFRKETIEAIFRILLKLEEEGEL